MWNDGYCLITTYYNHRIIMGRVQFKVYVELVYMDNGQFGVIATTELLVIHMNIYRRFSMKEITDWLNSNIGRYLPNLEPYQYLWICQWEMKLL